MSSWRRVLATVATNAEERFDTLQLRFKQRFGLLDTIRVIPFRGHGNRDTLYLKGRVIERRGLTPASDRDSVWENLGNMLRRFTADEIFEARVRGRFQNQVVEATTDRGGYFDLRFPVEQPLPPDQLWHAVEIELLEPKAEDQGPTVATGQVMVPLASTEFVVISDIDDTVVKTNATDVLKMARVVFLNNAHTRLPFPGVGAFYRALFAGSDGQRANPIFYVSSSPWDIYDLFVDFFALHDLPESPLFLRDFGIDEEEFLSFGHKGHKLERIRPLFETYPSLPFLLLGDSGQEDPEIYQQLVQEFPGRVRAIYIRDVATPERSREVAAICELVEAQGVEMLLVPDTQTAAEHAARRGFIAPTAVADVDGAAEQDTQPPSAVEQLLDALP